MLSFYRFVVFQSNKNEEPSSSKTVSQAEQARFERKRESEAESKRKFHAGKFDSVFLKRMVPSP